MKNELFLKISALVTLITFVGLSSSKAQMKIGENATDIQPFSILELESGSQGLRLSQVQDTSDVDASIALVTQGNIHDLTIPEVQKAEGLLVYQKQDSSVYVRVRGHWRNLLSSIVQDHLGWRIGGNLIAGDTAFLGPVNDKVFSIGSDSIGYVIITPDGVVTSIADSSYFNGFVKISSVLAADSLSAGDGALQVGKDSIMINRLLHVSNSLQLDDSLVLRTVHDALDHDTSVLILGSDGTVRKLSMNRLLTGFAGPSGTFDVHLQFGSDATGHHGPWIDSATFAIDSTLTLHIPSAGIHVRGLMDTTAQAFSGAKTFVDSIAVGGGTDRPNASLDVRGNINMRDTLITTPVVSVDDAAFRYRTINVNVVSPNGLDIILPPAASVRGRIYTIKRVLTQNQGTTGSGTNNAVDRWVSIKPATGESFDDGHDDMRLYNVGAQRTVQATLDPAEGGKWRIISQ